MSGETENTVKFRNAIIGYQKTEVEEYISQVKTEILTLEEHQKKLEEELHEKKTEIENLQKQLNESEKKYEDLNTEYEKYRNRMEAEGIDPKIIQDAILNAQRMSEIVLVEAQQKALDIREKARRDKQQQEEESKKLLEDAKTEALRLTSAAEIRCDNLQHEYDRILLDVTGFKSELMKMYRKHMELLAALPTKEIVEVQDIAETQKSVILE